MSGHDKLRNVVAKDLVFEHLEEGQQGGEIGLDDDADDEGS